MEIPVLAKMMELDNLYHIYLFMLMIGGVHLAVLRIT